MHSKCNRHLVSELLVHHFSFMALDPEGKSASWIEQCLSLQYVPCLSRCAPALSNLLYFLLAGPSQKASTQTASHEKYCHRNAHSDLQPCSEADWEEDTRYSAVPRWCLGGFGVFPPPRLATCISRADITEGIPDVVQMQLIGTKHPVSSKIQPNTSLSMLAAWPWHASSVPFEGFIPAAACYCPSNTTLAFCAEKQGEGVLFGLSLSLWIHCALCVCF